MRWYIFFLLEPAWVVISVSYNPKHLTKSVPLNTGSEGCRISLQKYLGTHFLLRSRETMYWNWHITRLAEDRVCRLSQDKTTRLTLCYLRAVLPWANHSELQFFNCNIDIIIIIDIIIYILLFILYSYITLRILHMLWLFLNCNMGIIKSW